PRGGEIAGQSALINLDGWTPREMLLKSPVAMHMNWPGAAGRGFEFAAQQQRSRIEVRRAQEQRIEALKRIFNDARAYADAKDPSLPRQDTDLKLDALVPAVRGQMPVIVNVNTERDIKKVIQFADELKLKVIIAGGLEAYKVADQLKAKSIPVLVGPLYRVP